MLRAYMWATNGVTSAIESLKQESGQDLIEYAVMVGAIAIVAFAVLIAADPLRGAMSDFAGKISACLRFDSAGCQ